MDEAQGGSLHQGYARAQRTQQANARSMHQRVDKKVEVCPLEIFSLEVDGEALIEQLAQQVIG